MTADPTGTEGLTLQVAALGGDHVVTVSGELDISTVGLLRRRLDELILDGAARLILDLRAVGFIDSSGLGCLVMAHRKMRVLRGTVAVVTDGGPVDRLTTITGLHHVLRIFPSVEEAREGE